MPQIRLISDLRHFLLLTICCILAIYYKTENMPDSILKSAQIFHGIPDKIEFFVS